MTPQINTTEAIYRFNLKTQSCENPSNCWIQFQSPEDAIRLEINGQEILKLDSESDYYSNEYFLLPISEDHLQKLTINAQDTNQDIRFAKELCIVFGKHNELRWSNAAQWFFRTGANLFSAYFLLIISFFLGFSFWIRRSGLGLSLLTYSVVSIIYLISFSEYPRSIFNPVIASGGFHFPLRLLQDLCLIFVFYNLHYKNDPRNVIKKMAWVYTIVIGIYALMLAIGIRDYIYYSRIIVIMAPLVAAPMAIGTWFAFKLKDPIERKVLIPVSIILFIFQVNDLFVFWKITQSYFTIRLYIPFIVGMALFLYFRRMHEDAEKLTLFSERQRVLKEFLHDVKSPLAVLRVFFAAKGSSEEHHQVINAALNRIEGMVGQVSQPNKNEDQTKFKLVSALNEVVAQKLLEYTDLQIFVETENDSFIFADKSKLQRIFSNLLNNSYEAYSSSSPKKIDIRFIFGADDVRILISDKGKGITKTVLTKLFKEEVTDKANGLGIGLSSAYKYITGIGGNLKVTSKEGLGTTIEIILLSMPSEVSISEIENTSQDDIASPDIILIDDDKYIRLSWKVHSHNTGRSIKAFDSLASFFLEANKFDRKIPIYLDINLNGERSLDHLQRFEQLGFKNIILASGEDINESDLPRGIKSISGKLPPLQ